VERDEETQRRCEEVCGRMEGGRADVSQGLRGIELMTTLGTWCWLCKISSAWRRDGMSFSSTFVNNLLIGFRGEG